MTFDEFEMSLVECMLSLADESKRAVMFDLLFPDLRGDLEAQMSRFITGGARGRQCTRAYSCYLTTLQEFLETDEEGYCKHRLFLDFWYEYRYLPEVSTTLDCLQAEFRLARISFDLHRLCELFAANPVVACWYTGIDDDRRRNEWLESVGARAKKFAFLHLGEGLFALEEFRFEYFKWQDVTHRNRRWALAEYIIRPRHFGPISSKERCRRRRWLAGGFEKRIKRIEKALERLSDD